MSAPRWQATVAELASMVPAETSAGAETEAWTGGPKIGLGDGGGVCSGGLRV